MNKRELQIIIEQLEVMENAFDDLKDCSYQIRKSLEKIGGEDEKRI